LSFIEGEAIVVFIPSTLGWAWDFGHNRKMPATKTPPFPVALPKGWPKHVRTSILHVISLAYFALIYTRSWAANSSIERVRLRGELDEANQEIALLKEELRIKDARMEKIEPKTRPHYPPTERLAILELRAARGWTIAETARRFMICSVTASTWMKRLDEMGADALIATPTPVNKFPELVAHLVQGLKRLSPVMGRKKLAKVLARCGLHLAESTVRRMLKARRRPKTDNEKTRPAQTAGEKERGGGPVVAKRIHHVWQTDLTVVPTRWGFWVPWCHCSLPLCWPFCWFVAVVIDQRSRQVLGYAVYKTNPAGAEIRAFLGRTISRRGQAPKYLVTDKGPQFHRCQDYRQWCARHGIIPRFRSTESINATGVIERFFRTMKSEYLRRTRIPFERNAFRRMLAEYVTWYHEQRPHTGLGGRTPDEVFHGRRPANRRARFEPRAKWPKRSRCAAPQAPPREKPGAKLELVVTFADKEKLLPIVELKRAA
jgi:putative transposase